MPTKNQEQLASPLNLTILYLNDTDPQIEQETGELVNQSARFRAQHQNHLETCIKNMQFGKIFTEYRDLRALRDKIEWYFALRRRSEQNNPQLLEIIGKIQQKIQGADQHLSFFLQELVEIIKNDKGMKALLATAETDEILKKHIPFFTALRENLKYQLASPIEELLLSQTASGRDQWEALYRKIFSALEFKDTTNEKKSFAEMTNILATNHSSRIRARTLREINDGLGGIFAEYAAHAFSVFSMNNAQEMKLRGYANPFQKRHIDNGLDDEESVKRLHDDVRTHAVPFAQEYWKIKAKLLRHKECLEFSDRDAPLPLIKRKPSYPEAIELTIRAYQHFNPNLAPAIDRILKNGWIDPFPRPYKDNGGFTTSRVVTPELTMICVFLGFVDSISHALIMGHEFGHAVHFTLSGWEQGCLQENPPVSASETAAILGSTIVFEQKVKELKKSGTKKELLAWYCSQFEESIYCTIGSIMYSLLEQKIYEAGRPLTSSDISMMFSELLRTFYGQDGDTFTYGNTNNLWAAKHHLFLKGYLYGYALCQLTSAQLLRHRDEIGIEQFRPRFEDFLRSGNTKNFNELLQPFGLDYANPNFWIDGIKEVFEKPLAKIKTLAKELRLL